ncbi:hypothetical protein [Streptomyces xantholiticus]|uniref:Uncharacterized protein n=1 Tax=Streptomyces xantholiticus TaxID=68285 RepID=A0ABV1V5F8_9ACTN
MDDLVAAGFRLNAPAPPDQEQDQDQEPAAVAGDLAMDQEHADVAALRGEPERLREKGAQIEDLQRALAAQMPPERA